VTDPVLIFLAGPNGAGKSTFFERYLADLGILYVNADRVAAAIRAAPSPAAVGDIDRRAFATTEGLRAALVHARIAFCTETVFSDPAGAKLRILADARARGFVVLLVFIGLASAELSIGRVVERVMQGGHDVPDAKLRARFPRTLKNLRAAIAVVDDAYLLDNSSVTQPYRPVAVYAGGTLVERYPPIPSWAEGLPGIS
jgi:predicted ABC-type ATPase